MNVWTKRLLGIAGVKLDIVWNVDKDRVCALRNAIVISNHQSHVDIVILESLFPNMFWLSC